MATQEKVNAVIVGAGASGSVFAIVLAKAGKKVVVMTMVRTGRPPTSSHLTSGAAASNRPGHPSSSKASTR
jgi:flavin-dependent dehydrogenase